MLQRRNSAEALRAEIIGRDQLSVWHDAWQRLSDNSIEDNAYYAPAYARALLNTVEARTDVRFAMAWQDGELIGFLPFVAASPFLSYLTPLRGWRSDYTYSCTPLLHRNWPAQAADSLVALFVTSQHGACVLPRLNLNGPAAAAIIRALEKRHKRWAVANRFARAVLDADGSFEEHMQEHVSAKRRRDLARNRRRLEKLGEVGFETCTAGSKLAAAVEAFLRIEAAGWKGRRRTALACSPVTSRFATKAFSGHDRSRADVLTLNSEPIAVTLTLVSGRTGFAVKCAYDERYASYSAGLLLEVEFLRRLLEDKWADRVDAGTDGAHVIDGLWHGRNEVGDLLFSCSDAVGAQGFSAFMACQRLKQAAIDAAKSVSGRLREK